MSLPLRFFVYRFNCHFCAMYDAIIDRFNAVVPAGREIRRLHLHSGDPILEHPTFKEKLKGGRTPYLFWGRWVGNRPVGVEIAGMTSPEHAKGLLMGLLEEEVDLGWFKEEKYL